MSAPVEASDLLDLKFLPAWVKEPGATNHYDHYTKQESPTDMRGGDRDGRHTDRALRSRERRKQIQRPGSKPDRRHRDRMPKKEGARRRDIDRANHRRSSDRVAQAPPKPFEGTIRFLPRQSLLENVVAQIKSGSVAYSLFVLARLFLEKPGRYEVRLTAKTEAPLYQLGENGGISVDREFLERNAFRFAQRDFYQVNVVESDPIKGSFSNVARCRLSGTLLGPTNHHAYQPQLRGLYEQRFSRRMSFADYQRQIEIVSDPAVVEQWKEQARSITTYHVKNAEPPVSFSNAADAERHFRQNYLPGLLREANELTISGVLSRRLPDRRLGRAIEDAWAQETRSPSKMMQELAAGLRQVGLNIFRHRRGMLFVSPVRARVFGHERAGVSSSINAILEKVEKSPGINRKQLAEQLAVADAEAAAAERAKMTLANDLHWLIHDGYIIEFNDSTLDLPRAKAPAATAEKPAAAEEKPAVAEEKPVVAEETDQPPAAAVSTEEPASIASAEPEPVPENAYFSIWGADAPRV